MLFLTKHKSNLIVYLVLINPSKFMSDQLHFPNNLKDIKSPYIGLYDKFQNLYPINGDNFQRKPELIAIPYILH